MTSLVSGAFATAFALYAVAGLSGVAYSRCVATPVPSNVLDMFAPTDVVA